MLPVMSLYTLRTVMSLFAGHNIFTSRWRFRGQSKGNVVWVEGVADPQDPHWIPPHEGRNIGGNSTYPGCYSAHPYFY